jgi:type I restriction enzyme R subunit
MPYGQSGGDAVLDLALKIDKAVKQVRPDGWRGVQAKEMMVKQAMYGVLNAVEEVERLFPIIVAHQEY